MKFYNPAFIKRTIAGHSWIGLFSAALLYLICLSGALSVFHEEFERWEQPYVDEFDSADIALIESAYQQFVAEHPEPTGHFHIVLPRPAIPRIVVENDHVAQFVNQDGSLGAIEKPDWTEMLVELHMHLHLPSTIGVIIVGLFGALLLMLIISGFMAHPNIIKDVFHLRSKKHNQLFQTDTHNRLSVWAAPFHTMIALTGAYFGLASLILILVAAVFYSGDRDAVIESIFGSEPKLEQPITQAQIGVAMANLAEVAPEAEPIFITVHEPNTPDQFIEFYCKVPGRLIYSKSYRFDSSGNVLNNEDITQSTIGRQLVMSTYRLHFGDFAGIATKLMYFILGLSLTVVSATGVNIWLAKRKQRDYINDLWAGFVWGAPFAFAVSAIAWIALNVNATAVFWLTLTGCCCYAVMVRNDQRVCSQLRYSTAASLIIVVIGYMIKFSDSAFTPAATGVNAGLLVTAMALLILKGSLSLRLNVTEPARIIRR